MASSSIYANIVRANQAVFFPHNINNSFLSWFIAWMNLDLGFEVCFYNGMDAYAKTGLLFVFPVYIWCIVILIIVSSHYYTSGRNAVQVLATTFPPILCHTVAAHNHNPLIHHPGIPWWICQKSLALWWKWGLPKRKTHSTVYGFSASTSGPLPTLHSPALVYPVHSTEIKIQSSVLDWEIQTSLWCPHGTL